MKLVPVLLAAIWSLDGARGATASQAAWPDRQQVESILIQSGYSGVATLRLDRSRWVGTGAHDGTVVAFVVDAATGRLVSEARIH